MKAKRTRRVQGQSAKPVGLTRREFGLATLAVAIAGCSTKKPPAPVDLAVYGDCRHFPKIHRRICASIVASTPKATVITGDLVDYPALQKEWDEFHHIVKDVRDRAPLLCAIGNHDVDPSNPFVREMKLEKTWYDRQVGDFHIFVLDSMQVFKDKDQLDWLQKTAEASKAKHKFAAFHHPPFIIDHKRMTETPEIRKNLHPLLVKLKFCAGLCGHQHAFYYTRRDGIPYVVTGGGGSPLGKLDTTLHAPGDLSRSIFHYVGLTVTGSKVQGRVYDPDGDEVPELAFPLCEHA